MTNNAKFSFSSLMFERRKPVSKLIDLRRIQMLNQLSYWFKESFGHRKLNSAMFHIKCGVRTLIRSMFNIYYRGEVTRNNPVCERSFALRVCWGTSMHNSSKSNYIMYYLWIHKLEVPEKWETPTRINVKAQ